MASREKFYQFIGLSIITFFMIIGNSKDNELVKEDWNNVERQENPYECGISCLKMIFDAYKIPVKIDDIRNELSVKPNGLSMLTMKEYAWEKGLITIAYKVNGCDFKEIKFPFIARINNAHFVVVQEIYSNKLTIKDPLNGLRKLKKDEFCSLWDKNVMSFEKK